jgi:hypothetical protein
MLDVTTPGVYLHHHSDLGEFWLTSDAVIPSWWRAVKMAHVIEQIPEVEREEFNRITYTIGAMMVFPGNQVGGAMTINGARGFDARIADRFDLTVECIRRYYLGEPSPTRVLGPAIARYPEFFGLFGDFAGYVAFFHLQDLVDEATSTVKFFTPFEDFTTSPLPGFTPEDFTTSPLPGTPSEYFWYRQHAIEFVEARNRRIAAYDRARG